MKSLRALGNTKALLLLYSVANGEPPIGIPWETFQKKNISYYERRMKYGVYLY